MSKLSYRRYLDWIERLRARLRKTSLTSRRIAVGAVVFLALVILLSLKVAPLAVSIEEGRPSSKTVRSPRTIQYVDTLETAEARNAAAAAVPEVLDYDVTVKGTVLEDVEKFFAILNETTTMPGDLQQKVDRVMAAGIAGIYKRQVEDLLALTPEQRLQTYDVVNSVASSVMEERITTQTLPENYTVARDMVVGLTTDPAVQKAAGELLTSFMKPNSVVNAQETERRRNAARNGVKPVITTVVEGEVVVNKGDTVTPDQFELLKKLDIRGTVFSIANILYMALFVLVIMASFSIFLARQRRTFFDSPGLLALMGGIVVIFSGTTLLLTLASTAYSSVWIYLVPVAAVAIIAAVLFDAVTAVLLVLVCTLITGILTGGNFSLVTFTLLGGLMPTMLVSRRSSRHVLRRSGLYTSIWLALIALVATLIGAVRQDLLLHIGIGFLNGVICTIVALGSLPFLETTFRVTTDTWLLELASPEQPLLKELSVRAPGTYSHSVLVANLTEAAARTVGTDPLLARVAAYYHDIGKMKRPQFFVENQPADGNPHDGLSPNLSALIITAHVKDGVDLLEKNHMPPDLVRIVKEHHGTGLIRYFYERARETETKPEVEESRFRYHFEKPRSKEAGILLLADAVEATARTLYRPSAATIEQMVNRIVSEKLADGQLDECNLTFRDLAEVKEAFAKILISTYHPRIDYPVQVKQTVIKRKDAGKNHGGAEGTGPGSTQP